MRNINLRLANSGQKPKKQKHLKDAHVEAEHMMTPDLFVQKDKSSKFPKKSASTAPCMSLNKREFVLKFVKESAAIVWPKEMKMINTLFKIAPDDDFWRSLDLGFKLNSLCWFLSDDGRKFLNKEYKKFKFEPTKPESYELENNSIEFLGKIGETVGAPMTVREFLTLWQKKN